MDNDDKCRIFDMAVLAGSLRLADTQGRSFAVVVDAVVRAGRIPTENIPDNLSDAVIEYLEYQFQVGLERIPVPKWAELP